MGDKVLVGGLTTTDTPAPRLYLTGGTASPTLTSVPLAPESPYAFEARWTSFATDGTRIVGVGGAVGGAHGNVRWTTWDGSASTLTELPQPFDTFGGWGAGQVSDVVLTPTGPVIVGSWGSAKAGLDASVWTFAGSRWTRQDPAGTALESRPAQLVGGRGAASDGAGILVAGSVLNLAKGSVAQQASLWRSTGQNTGWHRVPLPSTGAHSEAVSATCKPSTSDTGASCLVAGQVDGQLAVWEVSGDSARRLDAVPSAAVSDSAPLPRPVLSGGLEVVVAPSGGATVVVERAGDSWSQTDGPQGGTPVSAAFADGRLYVVTAQAPDGPGTLWVAPLGR